MVLVNQFDRIRTNRDISTLEYALVKAYHHDSGGRQRIWVVATDNRNNIIAEGGNFYNETHPLQMHFANVCGITHRGTLHAEINVFSKLKRMRKKCSKLFIARSGYLQRPLLAQPCDMCVAAIKSLKIKKVFWSNDYKGTRDGNPVCYRSHESS